MSFGIAEHVNGTQLDIGVGKHTLGDAEQAGEVVVDDNHDAPEAPFQERAQDGFPTLEVFAAMFYETAQDFLSAVAVKAGDEVDASRPQTFVFFDFDVLTIEEDGEHVGVDGS